MEHAAPRPAAHVRAARHDNGVIVLDLRSGRYHVPNEVGSLIWQGLLDGRGLDDLARDIALRCGVPVERARADSAAFLAALERAGLVEPAGTGGVPSVPRQTPPAEVPPRAAVRPAPWRVAAAFVALVGVDLSVKCLGFRRIHALLRRLPHARQAVSTARGRALSSAVDGAASYYFKRAWCLQRSLATVLLMRLRGWPARLVIGAQRLPFAAHAWVELDGLVVNDDPLECARFAVLERC